MLTRLAEIIKIARKIRPKSFVSGLSMKTNIQIAQNLGIPKNQKGVLLSIDEIHKYKDKKDFGFINGSAGRTQRQFDENLLTENTAKYK